MTANLPPKNTLFLLFSLALVAGALVALKILTLQSFKPSPSVLINNHTVFVEVADTSQKITRGLSGREELKSNEGMLFVLEKPGLYPFWMKDMKFNLDFVFILNNQVVETDENVPFPKIGERPISIDAKHEFDKVLEVRQETVKNLQIKVGDLVEYQL